MKDTTKREKLLIIISAFLAITCIVLIVLFLSEKRSIVVNTADGKELTYSLEEAENITNILTNASREIIASSQYADKKIYVIGHKSPDLDTVGSAISYARLLNELGYDAEPRITMKPSGQTRFALEYCNIPVPEILQDATDQNIILVDISDYSSGVDGLEKANILGIIDHHTLNIHVNSPVKVETAKIGATQTLVGLEYLRNGIVPDEQTAKLMALTILSDTGGLSPSSALETDNKIYNWAAEIGNVNFDEVMPKLEDANCDYTGMSDSEIFYSDYKTYIAGDDEFKYIIGVAHVKNKADMKDMALRLQKFVNDEYENSEVDMLIAQVLLTDYSAAYYAVVGEDADNIFTGAVGDLVTFDADTGLYYSEPSLNRKTTTSPKINEFVSK